MPRVPVYDGPDFRSAALQPAFQRAPDVGQAGAAASRALSVAAEAADRIDARDAQAKAYDAEANITSSWLAWDAENRGKYQGGNVDQYQVEASKWWDATRKQYEGVLDPRAQALVSRSLGAKFTSAMADVTRHVQGEKEKFFVDSTDKAIKASIQAGITNGNFAGTASDVRAKVAAFAAHKGLNTDQTKELQLQYLSSMHLAAIAKLADTNPSAAREYFNSNKAEIDGGRQQTVENLLQKEEVNAFAREFAQKVAKLPYKDQVEQALAITDGEKQAAAVTRVRANYAMVKEAKAEGEAQAADVAWQLVRQRKQVPEAVLASMDGHQSELLRKYVADREKHEAAGGTPASIKTDPSTHRMLWAMAGDKPDEFAKLNLQAYGMKLSSEDYEQLTREKMRLNQPKKDSPGAVSMEQQLTGVVTELGLKAEDKGKFQSAFYREFEAARAAAGGKEPDYKARQEIVNRLTAEVMIKGRFWDSKKPRWKMTPEERAAAEAELAKRRESMAPGQVYIDVDGNTRRKQ